MFSSVQKSFGGSEEGGDLVKVGKVKAMEDME